MADTKIIDGEKFERVGDAFLMFNSAGKLMALGGERQANTTREIMRRVNLHDELREELEHLAILAENAGWHKSITESARALLAKAKGEA